jgi:hypothetical protein
MQTLQSARSRIPVECRALNTPQLSIKELQAEKKKERNRKNVMYWHMKKQNAFDKNVLFVQRILTKICLLG